MKAKSSFTIAILLILSSFAASAQAAPASHPSSIKQAALGVISRIIPTHATSFELEVIPAENGRDAFELESAGDKIILRGSSPSAILFGLNWYLKYYCNAHVSWSGDQLNLPAKLPSVPKKVRIVSPYLFRYIYNYCTFNYTMSFWTWKDWERELDFLALNGVNMALASVVGQEALWQNWMKKLGYTDKEIFDFIPGPAYQAWWLMDNLEGWGGPVTQDWIDARAELQKKILARMRELGMEPVMQGFYGMVPRATFDRYPDKDLIETGIWGRQFKRPPMLLPKSPQFSKFAQTWYDEQKKLFGDTKYFGGDPFHEGDLANVDLAKVAKGIQKSMLDATPDSVWVLQGWMNNPSPMLLAGTKKSNVLVLDLFAEKSPQWRARNNWQGIPWIWCTLSNFGGKVGMHGALGRVASEPLEALKASTKGNMVGIGEIMEGSLMNAPLWELVFEMAWRTEKPDLDTWITQFATRRYGKTDEKMTKAWKILKDTVYRGKGEQEDEPRSLFCEKPGHRQAAPPLPGPIFSSYDACRFGRAWKIFVDEADIYKGIKTYEYDLVDVSREAVSNTNLIVYYHMMDAFKKKDMKSFDKYSALFMEMMSDEDSLLGTTDQFMLGKWLEQAKAWGKTDAEKKLFEWNARTLITTWGDQVGYLSLDDYASKEWSGALNGYYAMRWKTYIDDLKAQLNGAESAKLDWFKLEEPWNRGNESYPSTPTGSSVDEARKIYKKYSPVLAEVCGKI